MTTLADYAAKGRSILLLVPGYYHPRVLPEVTMIRHLAAQSDALDGDRLRILRAMRLAFRRAIINATTDYDLRLTQLDRIDQIFLPEIGDLTFRLATSIGKSPSEVPIHVLESLRA